MHIRIVREGGLKMRKFHCEISDDYVEMLMLRIQEELFVMLISANPKAKAKDIVAFLNEDEVIERLIQKTIKTFLLSGDVNPAIQVCLDEMKDDFLGVLNIRYVEGRKSF